MNFIQLELLDMSAYRGKILTFIDKMSCELQVV
jgi:hypothetical protein